MSSGSAFGEANLKETICDYLFHARNVRCVPEQIVIGAGNEYLQLLLAQMLGKEHCVAMESPTYLRAYKTFRNIGFPVQEVALDESGMRVDLLRETDASHCLCDAIASVPTWNRHADETQTGTVKLGDGRTGTLYYRR